MSSANVKVIQISSRSNPEQILELKGAGVKETSFTISNITKSEAWKNANFGVNDLRTKIGFKPLQVISYQDVIDYFTPLMADTVDILIVESNTFVVGAVNLTPATVSKAQDTTQQFVAEVLPAKANQGIIWSIAAGTGLSIDEDGLVTIGASTPVGTYVVTAKSVADPTKSDTAVLTVTL